MTIQSSNTYARHLNKFHLNPLRQREILGMMNHFNISVPSSKDDMYLTKKVNYPVKEFLRQEVGSEIKWLLGLAILGYGRETRCQCQLAPNLTQNHCLICPIFDLNCTEKAEDSGKSKKEFNFHVTNANFGSEDINSIKEQVRLYISMTKNLAPACSTGTELISEVEIYQSDWPSDFVIKTPIHFGPANATSIHDKLSNSNPLISPASKFADELQNFKWSIESL